MRCFVLTIFSFVTFFTLLIIIKMFHAAFATALDIGLSNWSFLFITISL